MLSLILSNSGGTPKGTPQQESPFQATTEEPVEASPDTRQALPALDVWKSDINLRNVSARMKEGYSAVRLHGSRNVQTMLGEATQLSDLQVFLSSSSSTTAVLPVVVLVDPNGKINNHVLCAQWINEVWKAALTKTGGNAESMPCPFYVSNHKVAVSCQNAGAQLQLTDLPEGCR